MGFDTHMILEPCLHCSLTRRNGYHGINRPSRHYAGTLLPEQALSSPPACGTTSQIRTGLSFYNAHRPHQGIANARPLHALPSPIPEPGAATRVHVHRRDRLGGILHEYRHAA